MIKNDSLTALSFSDVRLVKASSLGVELSLGRLNSFEEPLVFAATDACGCGLKIHGAASIRKATA